jgi:hypothetical protein
VLQFFPFVGWLAAATSVTMLAMLAAAGELRARGAAFVVALFVTAAYCQFFSASAIVSAAGLGLQTLLAIALIVRWRLSA